MRNILCKIVKGVLIYLMAVAGIIAVLGAGCALQSLSDAGHIILVVLLFPIFIFIIGGFSCLLFELIFKFFG